MEQQARLVAWSVRRCKRHWLPASGSSEARKSLPALQKSRLRAERWCRAQANEWNGVLQGRLFGIFDKIATTKRYARLPLLLLILNNNDLHFITSFYYTALCRNKRGDAVASVVGGALFPSPNFRSGRRRRLCRFRRPPPPPPFGLVPIILPAWESSMP